MFHIFYTSLDLDGRDRRCGERYVQEFQDYAAAKPLEIPLVIEALPARLQQRLNDSLDDRGDKSCLDALVWVFLDDQEWESKIWNEGQRAPKIVVLCSGNHPLAQEIKERNPVALWGGAPPKGPWAVVYHIDRIAIWHEMLHLVAAEVDFPTNSGRSIKSVYCS